MWIVSRDSDYCIKHEKRLHLNALLYEDLKAVQHEAPDVRCFENIDEGIRDFVVQMGLNTEQATHAERI